MVEGNWNGAHDKSGKSVLGSNIPAGQSASQDLNALISILTTHPNAAPFVSRRLIQNMVSSDPSPAYLSRVASVFKSTGGDLQKVVKAILLDPEARAGDDPSMQIARNGKIKEPVLVHTNFLRALGCTSALLDDRGNLYSVWTQNPYNAPTVFGYFSPNHLAPESLLPAPEQKLITSDEVRRRASDISYRLQHSLASTAGCELDLFVKAAAVSDDALIGLIQERFFKGAMPAPLRQGAKNLLARDLVRQAPLSKFTDLMQVLISTPTYGVVK